MAHESTYVFKKLAWYSSTVLLHVCRDTLALARHLKWMVNSDPLAIWIRAGRWHDTTIISHFKLKMGSLTSRKIYPSKGV
jgi:hypothetical protein